MQPRPFRDHCSRALVYRPLCASSSLASRCCNRRRSRRHLPGATRRSRPQLVPPYKKKRLRHIWPNFHRLLPPRRHHSAECCVARPSSRCSIFNFFSRADWGLLVRACCVQFVHLQVRMVTINPKLAHQQQWTMAVRQLSTLFWGPFSAPCMHAYCGAPAVVPVRIGC